MRNRDLVRLKYRPYSEKSETAYKANNWSVLFRFMNVRVYKRLNETRGLLSCYHLERVRGFLKQLMLDQLAHYLLEQPSLIANFESKFILV